MPEIVASTACPVFPAGVVFNKKINKINKMGEETSNSTQSKTRTKTTRPKAVHQWTVTDVLKWYRRHCGEYIKYETLFAKHDITGRALLRITDTSLQRMGVTDNRDREAIWREIVKQRLKTDIMEIRDMERLNI